MQSKEDFIKDIKRKKKKEDNSKSKYIKTFILNMFYKSLITLVIFLMGLIFIKNSDSNKEKVKKVVYQDNISFSQIYNFYKKNIGDIIPFKNIYKDNIKKVSNDTFDYKNVTKQSNGFLFEIDNNYIISSFQNGLVIEKSEDSIKIDGDDGVIITYGNLDNINLNIYDEVEKGEIIGEASDEVYLEFYKDGEYLSYEKFI